MFLQFSIALLVLWTYILCAAAHLEPHEHSLPNSENALARREFLQRAQSTIARCHSMQDNGDIYDQEMKRRVDHLRTLSARHGLSMQGGSLDRRDFDTVLNTNHASGRTGLSSHPSDAELFSGSIQCVLQPEVTVGPYWVKGEMVRSDIKEDQMGVPLYMAYQIIDTTTCKPLPNAYVDVWHANATGVYSGVVARNNGNRKDTANLYRTYNRGIQKTDSNGIAFFQSIYPGHYTGRAHHIHLIATIDASENANHALSGGHISHVGQVFFDESLNNAITQVPPYTTNTQRLTPNREDDIMQEEAASMDPVFRYAFLGNRPADGVLAWITIGVDPRAEYAPRAVGEVSSSGARRGRGIGLFGM